MSVQVIEQAIQDTFLETQKIFFKEESNSVIRVGSDKYLDLILDFQQSFKDLTERCASLNEALEEAMEICSDEFLANRSASLRPLLKSAKQLISTFTRSHFYPGIKSQLNAYRLEVSCFTEIIQDIELRTKTIKEDDEFQSLISQINSL